MKTTIRPAILNDLPTIVSIYNEVIQEGGLTADLEPVSFNEKKVWFAQTNTAQYGIYVLIENNQLIGYFYFSPWRKNRAALKSVAELSYYLSKKVRGKGLGNLILTEALHLAKAKNLQHLMAILLDSNKRSTSLLEKHGFKLAGHLPEVAQMKTKKVGQYIMLRSDG